MPVVINSKLQVISLLLIYLGRKAITRTFNDFIKQIHLLKPFCVKRQER